MSHFPRSAPSSDKVECRCLVLEFSQAYTHIHDTSQSISVKSEGLGVFHFLLTSVDYLMFDYFLSSFELLFSFILNLVQLNCM